MRLIDVLIRRELVWGRGVIQHHTLLRADDEVEHRLREFRWRHDRLSEEHLDRIATGGGYRLDSQFVAARQDQEAAVSAGVFERNHHECLDQLLEHDLAKHRLRRFDHCGEVQVLDGRPDRSRGTRW